ncbi:MAG: hypothetical protein JNM19_10035 [Chitinophagaceae bacterium]|nr:hypothetical protein [Chitinophagaceae bacterium]
MSTNNKGWQRLFIFCFGLFAGTAFCMKWMESDFIYNEKLFTIIGLEVTYPKEKVAAILGGLDGTVRRSLEYHLYFDFAFMVGVYPGILALCMMARNKSANRKMRLFLSVLAIGQFIAFGCDIAENWFLLQWLELPMIGSEFGVFHIIVYIKWILALSGALIAIPLALRRGQKKKSP